MPPDLTPPAFTENPRATLPGSAAVINRSRKIEAQIKRYTDDTFHRQVLVYWSMGIVTAWLAFVMYMLFTNKCDCGCAWVRLSDPALITLMGTSTLNIIGLVLIVLKGYFPSIEKEEKAKAAIN